MFDKQFNLPDPNITVHDCGPIEWNTYSSIWEIETSLDVEWAHAMAPDANIMVVNAKRDQMDALLEAVDYAEKNGADIISMSWGLGEDEFSDYAGCTFPPNDGLFSDTSKIYVAAAGDDGAESNWPATSPNVISVGGTLLNLNSNNTRKSETVWKYSGGGVSDLENMPSWQINYGLSNKGMYREMPDVSFEAGSGVPAYCSVPSDLLPNEDNWYWIGGTSFGTAAWAGIIADMNQNAKYIEGPSSLYAAAGSSKSYNPLGAFYDITSGYNVDIYNDDSKVNSASKGYDLVTGLGSPNCSKFVGVTYCGHVQKKGWQNYIYNGALAGTTGKSLRMEAVRIKLAGTIPDGAAIRYKAHVQKIGWQNSVANGAIAGTVGKSRRMEAIKITLSGMPGYQVSYRAHVQKLGWLPWQKVKNGTNIDKAGVAGTTGKGLRMEALEIKIEKVK